MSIIPRYNIPAGDYSLSEKKPLLLQAYLGTCVGVALYCPVTHIGGIIHLLLPEPISLKNDPQQQKYASTGVPLFIQDLIKTGAQMESLEATLAGGALVGPLSKQDLDLDIGGRTVEKVKQILNSQGIKIVQSETGGFFTCCLELNMETGQSSIEPAGYSKLADIVDIKSPSAAEIKQTMDHLRPIPQVVFKVLRMMDQADDPALDDIADEIRQDQVLMARTLQVANSALFAKKRQIDSLDHALVYLGRDLLIKVVISAAVENYFEQSTTGYSLCKGGIYHHAIGCAVLAETLACQTGKVDPQKAYTAGLLHDIGKVVLDQYVAAAYPLFYRKVMTENESVLSTEKRLLGIDHTEAGRLLAQQWSFPTSLVQAIRHHHQPDKATDHIELATIVYLAELLLSRFHVGLELERLDTHALDTHLNTLDLNTDAFEKLVDLIPPEVLQSKTIAPALSS